MKHIDLYKDYISPFYAVPAVSSFALRMILYGQTNLGPYDVPVYGLRAQIIGLFFLLIPLFITYKLLIFIPKRTGGIQKIKEILKIFFYSPFFFMWLICIVLMLFLYYHTLILCVYIISLVICYYFQKKFVNTLLNIYVDNG